MKEFLKSLGVIDVFLFGLGLVAGIAILLLTNYCTQHNFFA